MTWMRRILHKWLNVPSLPPTLTSDLAMLQDRMDSLEQLLMTKLQQPDPIPLLRDEPVDEGRLADLPDAHLGAQ